MFRLLLREKETPCISKRPWDMLVKDQTGGDYNERITLAERCDIAGLIAQKSNKLFQREEDLITRELFVGRIENIEKDFIMLGFDMPEENRREYYPIDKNLVGFEIQCNDLIEMEIIRNKSKSRTEINFYKYEESEFFLKRENDLIEKLANFEELPEDDF